MGYDYEGAGLNGKLYMELEQVSESVRIYTRAQRDDRAQALAKRMKTERRLRQRLRCVQDRVRRQVRG